MRIERDRAVALEYTLKGDDGVVIDTNVGDDALWYLHGHQNVIPGLEKALEGQEPGASLDVVVEPADGYGEPSESLIFEIEKSKLPQGMEPARGAKLQVNAPGGGRMVATITKVKLQTVTVDANHELAGKRLHFSVKVGQVRKATREELAHGHVHAPGHGHHH
jgi:FKBP-type peptidyl-prolyl cis-trans isomerase SlyD